jgi:hypothetical protein
MANIADPGSDDEYEHPNQPPKARKGKARAPDPLAPTASPIFPQNANSQCPSIVPPPQPAIKLLKTKDYLNVSKITEQDHLTDNNWHEWKECMQCILANCEITGYADGTLKRPFLFDHPAGVSNWAMNNAWAQQVIIQNVTSLQMNHVGSKVTVESMYAALVDTHDNKAHQTVNHIQTLLYEMKASETDDILKHLDILKSYRDRLNKFPNTEFHVYNTRFKSIISASLPLSWQSYVKPYNGNANDPHNPDPK